MRSWVAVVVLLTATAFCSVAGAVRLLDAPYVPQSPALCGGAALAMVFRFWGEDAVHAEDFVDLLEPNGAGISTTSLVAAVESRGWTALVEAGSVGAAQTQLERGRPVIALLGRGDDDGIGIGSGIGASMGATVLHYVVVVAWANGGVIVHDPNSGPHRVLREAEFDAAWASSGRWMLIPLPPARNSARSDSTLAAAASDSARAFDSLDGCDAIVERGVAEAQRGAPVEAETTFRAAAALCPESSAPLRELAGLRFLSEDWTGASDLAEQAVALDRDDTRAWKLLAGSRYLAGDTGGALDAWNAVSAPRTDLVKVDGLSSIRYRAVTNQLDLSTGEILTRRDFSIAQRRLHELPALSAARMSVRPTSEGVAQVDVAVLERSRPFASRWDLVRLGVGAALDRELELSMVSLLGHGELLTVGGRWWEKRPRVAVSLDMPGVFGRTGVWRVAGSWEEQSYVRDDPADESWRSSLRDSSRSQLREERRRSSVSFADWATPNLRYGFGVGLDEWNDRNSSISVDGTIERRAARDRLALIAEGARWTSVDGVAPFSTVGASALWRSAGLNEWSAWRGRIGLSSASSRAPMALWSGAGTGQGRPLLLRAHPLLDDRGVIEGEAFGRALAHGSVEHQRRLWSTGPVRIGGAVFVDAARPWETEGVGREEWLVDGGVGVRVGSVGMKGQVRVDVAHGVVDGETGVSVGWETR